MKMILCETNARRETDNQNKHLHRPYRHGNIVIILCSNREEEAF
jgi:hypothetical protein